MQRSPFGTSSPLLALSLVLLLTGCASGIQPGTGDLSFRLRWDGAADLDLHVIDPLGRHVGIEQPAPGTDYEAHWKQQVVYMKAAETHEAVPAGILDIDCNADPNRVCKRPIENVYWPTGTAPDGRYEVWVRYFQDVFGDDPVPYVLEIRRGETIVATHRGELDATDPRSEVVGFEYGS